MIEILPPLAPPGCDLRDFPRMPIEVARLRRSRAWLIAKKSPELGFYMMNLWMVAWHEMPPGSLEDDDEVLCEFAMCDVKRWTKVREQVMRHWIKCSDGRLYHPVVIEMVTAAWDSKIKQRLKTAKARIAALEKHLKEAKTESEKARITDEIQKIQQMMSLSLSQTQQQPPREGKGREEKGLVTTPNGVGADAPNLEKPELWKVIKTMLREAGVAESACGGFITKLIEKHTEAVAIEAMQQIARAPKPGDIREYLPATCQHLAGQRHAPNKQEALEKRNRDVADAWAAEGIPDATH